MGPTPACADCLDTRHAGESELRCEGCRWSEPFQDFAAFLPAACDYSAIILATFPEQHGQVAEQLATMCPGQKLVFVVHNSQELLRKGELLRVFHVPCALCLSLLLERR